MRQLPKCIFAVLLPILAWGAEPVPEFCPNPGAEELLSGGLPAHWRPSSTASSLDAGEAHSGKHSLKVSSVAPGKFAWTSDPIAVPAPDMQFALSCWAKLESVTGGNGAYVGLHHLGDNGERVGQSGGLSLGGVGDDVATTGWRQYVTTSELTPDVKAVRIDLRLYRAKGTVWFDDVSLNPFRRGEISAPRPLRRGLRLEPDRLAVCSARGADDLAGHLQAALKAKGVDAPVLRHDQVTPASEKRDLIVLGNLATSEAVEWLYLRYYTYEDLYFPGTGGHVLRPLIDPLGTGVNIVVVGASDDKGLAAGVEELLRHIAAAENTLDLELTVKTGPNYRGLRTFPWPGPGPFREMEPSGAYLKSGDMAQARAYRDYLLDEWFTHTDESLADRDNSLHLVYHSKTMSWDLTESCGVFSDDERLELTRQLLTIMRSNQAYGYKGLNSEMRSRGNHDVRNARSFYFGYRYFDKYYRDVLSAELGMWRQKLEGFWAVCFSSFRSNDDALASYAFGGSLNCILDVGLMEPAWSKDFFVNGLARMMGERSIAVCNNLGQMILLGDVGTSDYPSAEFAKLAYRLRDGRYRFMIDKRGATRTHSDEAMRGFNVGVQALIPEDHVGLKVIPADPLFFTTGLRNAGETPLENGFDKIAFRNGFDPADEYLLVEGVAGPGHSYDDGDGLQELLVGSDDEHVYALDASMKERWRYEIPFLAKRFLFWSLYKAKARRIHCEDIDGDGKPEVLVGAGDMHLHCLDSAGSALWSFHTPYGVPTTILTADVFGDGKRRIVAGNGLMTYTERCWVLDGAGQLIDTYYGDVRGTPVIAVGDLDRDGTNTFFSGNLRGRLRAWTAKREPTTSTRRRRKPRWTHTFPKPIRSLTVLPGDTRGLLAVCSESGYLCAFNDTGDKAWGIPLSSGISSSALVRRAGSPPLLAAGCKDGRAFLLTRDGELRACFESEGQLQDMIVTDLDEDGSDELVIATADPNRLRVVATAVETP